MGWIQEAAGRPLADVASALGWAGSERKGYPCPACRETKRGSSDRRGPVGVTRGGRGWRCHRCDAHGDSLDYAALVLGGGLSLAVDGALGDGGDTVMLVSIMCAVGSLAILVPSIRLLRQAPETPPVRVRPAAVLPPELVRVGNWIHRDGAWLRVEEIGRDGGGRIQALLSSGDLVVLGTPVTIAGDDFRPVSDPIASLRS